MSTRFSVEAVFKAVDKITAPLQRMRGKVGKFTTGMSRGLRSVNSNLDGVIRNGRRAGLVLAAGLAVGLVVMKDIVETGAAFEQSITNAVAKIDPPIDQLTSTFNALSAAAQKAGASTEFTASQSADALTALAAAGFNVEQAVAVLPAVTDLATAAQVDLGEAAKIASKSLGAFNLRTKDAAQLTANLTRIMDVMTKTSNSATTNVSDLFEAFKEGAALATKAGASVETVSAFMGILADASKDASKAGTTLRNMYMRLLSPTKDNTRILKALRVETKGADGNLEDMVVILDRLSKSMKDLDPKAQADILTRLFGARAVEGVLALMNKGTAGIEDYRDALEGAGGSAKKAADLMRGTLGNRLKILQSTIESIKLSIFEVVKGPVKEMVESLTAWARANREVIAAKFLAGVKFLKNNFSAIVKTLKLFGVLASVFGVFVVGVKAATAVMWALNLAMNANPVGLIIIAVAALIAILATMIIFWDDIRARFNSFSEAGKAVTVMLLLLMGPIGWFILAAGLIIEKWAPISKFFGEIWDGVVAAFEIASHFVGLALDAIGDAFKAAKEWAVDFIGPEGMQAVEEFLDGFLAPINAVIDAIKELISLSDGLADNKAFAAFAASGIDTVGAALTTEQREAQAAARARQAAMISPQDRAAKSAEQKDAQITLRTEGGTSAEVTNGSLNGNFKLDHSGSDGK